MSLLAVFTGNSVWISCISFFVINIYGSLSLEIYVVPTGYSVGSEANHAISGVTASSKGVQGCLPASAGELVSNMIAVFTFGSHGVMISRMINELDPTL